MHLQQFNPFATRDAYMAICVNLKKKFRTYRVASLHAGLVGRISYNLYFDCKHARYVTCDLINKYTFPLSTLVTKGLISIFSIEIYNFSM